jgi:pyrophosphatase PpaX
MPMKQYTCYLFDADGTLIDTIDLIVRCFEHTCAKFCGISVPAREIIKNIGLTLREQMERFLGPLADERFEIILREHMDFQRSHYREYLKVFPGVAEGLAELTSCGKRCAVVTSRKRESLEVYLKETGIYDYFKAFVTMEATQRHKPEPEPALKALALLGGKKEEALFIGASRFDIECAANAGIDSAFVKWSRNDPSELVVQPTMYIDDLRELFA